MKLIVAGLMGVMVSAAMMGCSPGLSHRVRAAEPQNDVFAALDAELSRSIASTTTVTSGEALPAAPSTSMDMRPYETAPAAEAKPVTAVTPTWGGEEPMGAGIAPAAVAPEPAAAPAAAASNDFNMHPYD